MPYTESNRKVSRLPPLDTVGSLPIGRDRPIDICRNLAREDGFTGPTAAQRAKANGGAGTDEKSASKQDTGDSA